MTFEEFCIAYVKNAMEDGSMACSCCPLSIKCSEDAFKEYDPLNEDEQVEICSDFILRVCGGK